MSKLEAWPFVVARNATLDWRPILAPSFLVDAGADYLLVTQTSGPGADPNLPNLSVVESSKAGTITLAFRSIPATSALLGQTPAEPLLDRFGRPLHIVEGLAIRGAHQVSPGNLQPVIDGVRRETLRVLPAFWEEESETVAAMRSQPVRISVASRETAVPPEDGKRAPENGSWPALPFAVVLLVALGAAAWWWFRAA